MAKLFLEERLEALTDEELFSAIHQIASLRAIPPYIPTIQLTAAMRVVKGDLRYDVTLVVDEVRLASFDDCRNFHTALVSVLSALVDTFKMNSEYGLARVEELEKLCASKPENQETP